VREVRRGLATAATRLLVLLLAMTIGACAAPKRAEEPRETPSRRTSRPTKPGDMQRGMASWYGADWHGRQTASGEKFNKNALTAAHRTLPFGSKVKVVHARTGRSVVVRINDRGPYSRRRIIDLSEAAARRLGIIDSGVAPVTLHVLSVPGRGGS